MSMPSSNLFSNFIQVKAPSRGIQKRAFISTKTLEKIWLGRYDDVACKLLHGGYHAYRLFVPNGINSIGDYNLRWVGVCLSVCLFMCLCVSPLFFTFHDGITSERFELLS